MKLLKILFLTIFLFISSTNAAEYSDNLKIKISKNLRCLICQGQSIYDSQSDFAISMRLVIEKKLNSGSTEEEIYEYLKLKYGEWIIYEPQLNKNTIILWLLPIL